MIVLYPKPAVAIRRRLYSDWLETQDIAIESISELHNFLVFLLLQISVMSRLEIQTNFAAAFLAQDEIDMLNLVTELSI